MKRRSIVALTDIDLKLHVAWLLRFFSVCWMEWIPIVSGNNTMSSYVYVGELSDKTGRTTSNKNPLVDLFLRLLSQVSVSNPVGGAIYW